MIKPKILAIIPARGGSKGLPRKNIRKLLGKPLICWTIEAALNSEYINRTIVSTDDEEICSVAKKAGVEVLIRPTELASDNATSESVVLHVLQSLQAEPEEYDYIILLQPTSPLRGSELIDESINLMLDSKMLGVISVTKGNSEILKSFLFENDRLVGVCNDSFPFTRRQDLPDVYKANGAIFIVSVRFFLRNKSFLSNSTVPYIMNVEDSIDIDTEQDLALVEERIKICL